jgi:predicted amidophosphoribosyltransferase
MNDLIQQQAKTLVQEVIGRARIGAWCPQCKKDYPSHYAHEHCPNCRSKLTRHKSHETTQPSKPAQTEFPNGSK